MKKRIDLIRFVRFWRICFIGFCTIYPVWSGYACTIFVLTDAKRTMFFNNEDYSNPVTKIWFLPTTKKYYGCAYLGFNDGWAQGGVNEYGLAFDWVAGSNGEYVPAPNLKMLQGNPAERMLESCKTVEESIAFYHQFKEPGFGSGRMLIADRTGASVIVGAKNGQIYFEVSHQSRGFGYGDDSLKKLLTPTLGPSISNGFSILKACRQEGQYATKYSSAYNLKTGEIYLVSFEEKAKDTKLNLAIELQKGGHYYDIPAINQQFSQPPVPLIAEMKRYLWEGYEPFPTDEPVITKLVKEVIKSARSGSLRSEDFTPEFWKVLAPIQKDMQPELEKLGDLLTATLIERNQSSRLYLMDYQNAIVLQRFEVDQTNRIAMIKSEAAETKIGTAREK